MSPTFAPPLTFGAAEQQLAYDEFGANCGPGAIAGICGRTPVDVLRHMPDFSRLRHTREWMLEAALDGLGIPWEHEEPLEMRYGIARVLWGGPWTWSNNRFDSLARSHWIGIARTGTYTHWVFDTNAISVGGWIEIEEWEGSLVPWLAGREVPDWDGTWRMGEGYALPLPPYDMSRSTLLPGKQSPRMERHDIRVEEHPYLHSHPGICGGRVTIRHSRITTTSIAGRLGAGETVDDLLVEYPDLTREMIEAARAHGARQLREGRA